ncbi:MAG: lipid A biosynthesis acyltransferase [Lacipirellulaceae bacterium]
MLRKAKDYSAYLAVRLVVGLVQSLPLETVEDASKHLAWFVWRVLKIRRKVVEENLKTAFPEGTIQEHEKIALGMWRHLFLMIAEIAHAPRKVHRTNWREHSTIPDMPTLTGQLLSGRPTVIISGHLGNFELGGYLLGLHGFPTHTIARQLDNPYLDRWVTEFRGATGQHMLSKSDSSRQIAHLLESGGTLVLLGDQYAGDTACWVDFFGKPASTHKAVAVFTLSGRAPTAVSGVLRRDKPLHFEMCLADLIDPESNDFQHGTIPALTQWYTDGLEQMIRQAPEQYWWVHRRWKGTPTDRRERRRKLRAKSAA